jgi:hypothetical protein
MLFVEFVVVVVAAAAALGVLDGHGGRVARQIGHGAVQLEHASRAVQVNT